MILSRYGSFTGGIDLPAEKDLTLALPIHRCPTPSRLRVPLAPYGGAPAEPVVTVGQQVATGERIAVAADESGVDIFAPLSGEVAAFTTVTVAGRYGLACSGAVELTGLCEPQAIRSAGEVFDWRAADPQMLRSRIYASGLSTYGDAPESLARWVWRACEKRCKALIANVMEDQPYVTAVHRLMVEHGHDVVRGLAILARATQAARVFLVADRRRTEDYRDSTHPAGLLGIQQVALPHRYPTGADAMLVKILTRREVPIGGSTMDVGAAVISAAACFAAYRRVACDIPPIGRVVTVSGERAACPGNFFAPFGMACLELAGHPELPVLHGGPMMGVRCDEDMVVSPATNAVLAIEPAAAPVPGPCIRCAWCRDRCPTRLNVAAMNDAFELSQIKRAEQLGAMACVECGVCSYVCPARLPLTQRMKRLKHAIRAWKATAGRAGYRPA
jgi:electron transport complex protein RnfC